MGKKKSKNTALQRFEQIVKTDKALSQIQDLDLLLEEILLTARNTVNAVAGSIYIVKNDRLEIRYAQNDVLAERLGPGQKLPYSIYSIPISNASISGHCAISKTLVNIPNAYEIPKSSPFGFNSSFDKMNDFKTRSILCIPMVTNNEQLLGVIQVINARGPKGGLRAFNQEDELLITHFAEHATLALQRAQLTRTILLRMIKMAEIRDPKETGPHVNRVAGYATEIYLRYAKRKNISEQEIKRNSDIFKMAAMLHDVGKVGISDLILKKPGRFTDEEYALMKGHTLMGAKLFINKQSEFDDMAAQVALTHHERWDGKGYPGHVDVHTEEAKITDKKTGKPKGLKGEEIPLWGRIVAIADVYDALSSKRVYKEAWTEDDVLAEIKNSAGKSFDPELVDIFFEALPQLRQISERYPDD
jgi:HD-GYP domain-containing protein (c-di-GMP phosphodiesterase class II)